MASSIDRVICVKNQVFVYKVPPRGSNRGYRAADWKLDDPDWVGRLRVVSGERECIIKLEDKDSGDLFAQCPVESYPGVAVEQVTDSSRYFVVRIKDEGGRSAFIGIGFTDRGDSFDLLVALQDHFKYVKREETQQQEAATFDTGPKLDLSFKEGQTIKINIKTKKNQEDDDDPIPSRTRGRPSGKGGGGLLPPPPAAGSTVKLIAPPRGPSAVGGQNSAAEASLFGGPPLAPAQSAPAAGGGLDLLADLTAPPSQPTAPFSQPQSDPWASLANRGSNPQQSQQSSANDWVQF